MPRNSGNYTAPSGSWSSGAVNGALATVADWQALLADISAALTQSVSKDGQTTITGNLNMGGNALTNLAAGVGAGQSLRFEQLFSQGVETDLASAATTDIGLQNTNFLRVTGTTTITSFGTNYNGPRFLRFAGALTLTNSATLILPGGQNLTTAAGDTLIAIPKATAGTADGWQVVAYQPVNGFLPSTNPNYTGSLTGGAGVVNLGSGQFYKDASGNVGVGTSSPSSPLDVNGIATVRSGIIRATNTGAVSALQLLAGTALGGGSGAAIVARGATNGTNNGGIEFYTANTVTTTEQMRLTSGGNFGIGSVSPTHKLEVVGTTYLSSTVRAPSIGSGVGTPLVIDASGFFVANVSSIRYKINVQPLDVGLAIVMQMTPVSYELKNGGSSQIGFIAEDFPEPRLVNKSMVDFNDPSKGTQVESINYSNLTAILVKAIQEQQVLITSLTDRITALEST